MSDDEKEKQKKKRPYETVDIVLDPLQQAINNPKPTDQKETPEQAFEREQEEKFKGMLVDHDTQANDLAEKLLNDTINLNKEMREKLRNYSGPYRDTPQYRSAENKLLEDHKKDQEVLQASQNNDIDTYNANYQEEKDKRFPPPEQAVKPEGKPVLDPQNDQWIELQRTLKKEREETMYNHFREMADVLRGFEPHQEKEAKEAAQPIIEANRVSMQNMAITHYMTLYDSPQNPIFERVIREETDYFKSDEYKAIKEAREKRRREEQERLAREKEMANRKARIAKHFQNRDDMLNTPSPLSNSAEQDGWGYSR